MKKWLSLFLAMILLVTAAFALAENVEGDVPQDTEAESGESGQIFYDSPVPFGKDPTAAPEEYLQHLHGYNFNDKPTEEMKKLPDGREYMVQTFVTKEGEANQLTAMLFYLDNKVVAGVEDAIMPEGVTDSGMGTRISSYFGGQKPFNMAEIGFMADMLGEAAHLDAAEGIWKYKNEILLNNETVTINAFITVVHTDGHMYMAEWYEEDKESAAREELQGLRGYDNLTDDEKIAVNMYSDYLEKEKMDKLQPYIDFLLSKHNQE